MWNQCCHGGWWHQNHQWAWQDSEYDWSAESWGESAKFDWSAEAAAEWHQDPHTAACGHSHQCRHSASTALLAAPAAELHQCQHSASTALLAEAAADRTVVKQGGPLERCKQYALWWRRSLEPPLSKDEEKLIQGITVDTNVQAQIYEFRGDVHHSKVRNCLAVSFQYILKNDCYLERPGRSCRIE